MASKLEIKIVYEDNYEEKCTILPDHVMEFESLPGKLTISQRKSYDIFISGLHQLMINATIKKIELEEIP